MENTKRVEIPFENPVPLEYTDTLERYIGTVAKAELLQYEVKKSKRYQFALVSEPSADIPGWAHREFRDYTIMYTSELDKRVHSVPLDYKIIHYNRKEPKFKDGFFEVAEQRLEGTRKRDVKTYKGLIAHNGKVIIEPSKSLAIDDLEKTFIICNKAVENSCEIKNYRGESIIKLTGNLSWRFKRMQLEGNNVTVICQSRPKNIMRYHGDIGKDVIGFYALYLGELYFFYGEHSTSVAYEASPSYIKILTNDGPKSGYKTIWAKDLPKIWTKITPDISKKLEKI